MICMICRISQPNLLISSRIRLSSLRRTCPCPPSPPSKHLLHPRCATKVPQRPTADHLLFDEHNLRLLLDPHHKQIHLHGGPETITALRLPLGLGRTGDESQCFCAESRHGIPVLLARRIQVINRLASCQHLLDRLFERFWLPAQDLFQVFGHQRGFARPDAIPRLCPCSPILLAQIL